jgi:hypothetical protein
VIPQSQANRLQMFRRELSDSTVHDVASRGHTIRAVLAGNGYRNVGFRLVVQQRVGNRSSGPTTHSSGRDP